LATGPNPATHVQGYILSICTVLMMVCAVVILTQAVAKWVTVLSNPRAVPVEP
jgi:hypothetical protein